MYQAHLYHSEDGTQCDSEHEDEEEKTVQPGVTFGVEDGEEDQASCSHDRAENG